MRNVRSDIRHAAAWIDHKIVGKSMVVAHASYYTLVTWEAHGTYRYAAGIICVFMVIEILSHSPIHGANMVGAVLEDVVSDEA